MTSAQDQESTHVCIEETETGPAFYSVLTKEDKPHPIRLVGVEDRVKNDWQKNAVWINKECFQQCWHKIRRWINVDSLMGQLVKHGLLNDSEGLYWTNPNRSRKQRADNLLNILAPKVGEYGHYLLYMCIRDCDAVGHGGAVRELVAYSKRANLRPPWLTDVGGAPSDDGSTIDTKFATPLMAETKKLDSVVDHEDLLLISLKLTDWHSIAPFLGLTATEEEEIIRTGRRFVQRIKLLEVWKKKFGPLATYRNLIKALNDCGRSDIKNYVEGLIDQPKSNHQEICHPSEVKFRHPSEAILINHPVEDTQLTTVDEARVQGALYPVEKKWRSIGRAFGLQPKYLDKVSATCDGDVRKCFDAVVSAWLRGEYMSEKADQPSWRKIVWVMADSAGANNPSFAASIAADYKALWHPRESYIPSAETILKAYPDVTQETQELNIDDVQFVIRAVHVMSHRWKPIGAALHVEGLDEIEKRFPNDPHKCLINTIANWMKNPAGPSWKKLVSAVADKMGGANPGMAEHIASHYKQLWRFNPGKIATTADSRPIVCIPTPIPNHPAFDERPTLQELQYLASTDGIRMEKIRIIEEISGRWMEVGLQLGFAIHHLDTIEQGSLRLKHHCTRTLLHTWLSSPTATWEGLITALNKARVHNLASRLINAVPNKA